MSPSAHVTTATLAVQDGSDPPATNDLAGGERVGERYVGGVAGTQVGHGCRRSQVVPAGHRVGDVCHRGELEIGRILGTGGSTVLLTVSPLLCDRVPGVDAVTDASTSKSVSAVERRSTRRGSRCTCTRSAIERRATRWMRSKRRVRRTVRATTAHHVAHLQFVHPDDVPRFGTLGVIANMQPLWACMDPQMTELTLPRVGKERIGWQTRSAISPDGRDARRRERLAGVLAEPVARDGGRRHAGGSA